MSCCFKWLLQPLLSDHYVLPQVKVFTYSIVRTLFSFVSILVYVSIMSLNDLNGEYYRFFKTDVPRCTEVKVVGRRTVQGRSNDMELNTFHQAGTHRKPAEWENCPFCECSLSNWSLKLQFSAETSSHVTASSVSNYPLISFEMITISQQWCSYSALIFGGGKKGGHW